ncbi:helix-turn-helix transcriptional regulator [Streptomyces sp. SP18ES09]|uniref:helix-turn-helix domain-containing protein n=1 Tax=Streptomyces sp. SP18ES09 TaxID=3002532 RepID=UPI002E76E9E1|nr:helix-turn-helix transcriptional regulator [Streptomyces sp. SP18ES09]MEE1819325.1 helix-turn-helix transcriptional regulator [Streptomyces sp. SP18ES09]
MEHVAAEDPVSVIARRVKEVRGRKGLTAQELADKLRDAGVPWDRATVTKLETRRRQNVSVVEFLALARALDVAPVHLLVTLGEGQYQVTPNEAVPAVRARGWVRGEDSMRGDPQIYYTERPVGEIHQTATLQPAIEVIKPKSDNQGA